MYLSYLLYKLSRERAVGNPSAIECQTANILNSRTGLWARCLPSLLLESQRFLGETKRRVRLATKYFFTFYLISEKFRKNISDTLLKLIQAYKTRIRLKDYQ